MTLVADRLARQRFLERSAVWVPPGWPTEVRPPDSPDWEATAVAFLLDCCPSEYRSYLVLRKHPVVLARFAAEFVGSQVRTSQTALAEARASLDDFVAPEVVQAAVEAWAAESERLVRRRREVALVEEALRGKVFIRRL
ncbi:MAG: hypothetical protein WAV45_11305 [Propionibacteriaceae bacterium]|nr:hypothetical protein [Micropruina sp.]